jgi:hypothetical protein
MGDDLPLTSRRNVAVLRRIFIIGLAGVLGASFACTRAPRWRLVDQPTLEDVETALKAASLTELSQDPNTQAIPPVPIRRRLRPCCAFGADLAAQAGPVPVPAFRVGNILGHDDLGPHTYDSGILHFRRSEQQTVLLNNEKNGLIYTCRGGFIDTAHVRDYADWSLFLGTEFARNLRTGTNITLPDEGGSRTIILKPVESDLLTLYDPVQIAIALAEWITFEMSVWHEIATWFWWSVVPGYPEKVSAFSPEDLYSNLIGIKLATAIAHRRLARTENLYNENVTTWLLQAVEFLGVVPKEASRDAMRAVDGTWWDSSKRLPDPTLVLRRDLDAESPQVPWLVPDSLATPALRETLRKHCGKDPAPAPLAYRSSAANIVFSELVTLHITVNDSLAEQSPFPKIGRVITQEDFPAIIAAIREQNRDEFGQDADRPD